MSGVPRILLTSGPTCLLTWRYCRSCSKPFVKPPDRDGLACSPGCRVKLNQPVVALDTRTCGRAACSEPFTADRRSRQRYCTDECRALASIESKPLRFFVKHRKYQNMLEQRLAHIVRLRTYQKTKKIQPTVRITTRSAAAETRLPTRAEKSLALRKVRAVFVPPRVHQPAPAPVSLSTLAFLHSIGGAGAVGRAVALRNGTTPP